MTSSMTSQGGIYRILNARNGHRYIGSAVNLRERESVHRRGLRKGSHHSRYLQRAWDKYEERAFRFFPLIYLEPWELIRHEQFFIDTLKPEYNICKVAGSQLGVKHSEESKAKQSKVMIGRKLSEEHKAKLAKTWIGRKHSDETKAKISALKMGTKASKETRLKLSIAGMGNTNCLGRKLSEEHKANISKAKTGQMHSREAKAKMSAAQKKRRADERISG